MILKIFNGLSIILMLLGIVSIGIGVFAFFMATDEALSRQWLVFMGGIGLALLLVGGIIKILLRIEKNTRK